MILLFLSVNTDYEDHPSKWICNQFIDMVILHIWNNVAMNFKTYLDFKLKFPNLC